MVKIVSENGLIKQEDWNFEIDRLMGEIKDSSIVSSEDIARGLVKEKLIDAVKRHASKEKFAILFSGGIDSTIIAYICKLLKLDFVCYCVGLEGCRDIEWSKKIADILGFELKILEIGLGSLEKVVVDVTKLLDSDDVVKVGVGSVFYPALKEIKKDGLRYVFSGLGSEEIFAGYQRHFESKDINKECWAGLKTIWVRDLVRDYMISQKFGLELCLPFLDSELIEAAMKIDSKLKIKGEYKKVILRMVAEDIGLDSEFCWRKKKAAQYGSKVNRTMGKIAKKKGFKLKKDYLKDILGRV